MESGDKVILWTRDKLNEVIKGLEKQTVESVDENVVRLENGFVCDITTVLTMDEACEMLQDAIDELQVLYADEAQVFMREIRHSTRFIDATAVERLKELEEMLPEDGSVEIELPYETDVCEYPIAGMTKKDLERLVALGFVVRDGNISTIH